MARRYIQSPEWEDVFHNAMERLISLPQSKMQNIIGNGALKSYAYLTVKNFCIDYIRKQKTEPVQLSEDIEAEAGDFKGLHELESNIESMYWYHRELLNLYIEHKSYRKIEAITGIPYKSVANGVRKAREILMEKMK